jgi:Uma2 family endonuclease
MSTTILDRPVQPWTPESSKQDTDFDASNRKRWTRTDCDLLERIDVLTQPYELLNGEIIEKMGQNRAHIIAVTRIFAWLITVFGVEYVQSQADIEVDPDDRDRNRPQPDAAVLAKRDFEYEDVPAGKDLRLIIEVSVSTLRDDLRTKSELYARAGVPEYWVLDVIGRRIYVHREPTSGIYASVEVHDEDASVAASAVPAVLVNVTDLLPPFANQG